MSVHTFIVMYIFGVGAFVNCYVVRGACFLDTCMFYNNLHFKRYLVILISNLKSRVIVLVTVVGS